MDILEILTFLDYLIDGGLVSVVDFCNFLGR